jgi:hypothetical protein
MLLECLKYALRGSVSRAGAWAGLPGILVLWLTLLLFGRRDVVLPTTFPGAIELFITCAIAAWLLVFLGKLLFAPYHFLKVARRDLAAAWQSEHILEITFDPAKADYLRLNRGLHGPQGEFYSVGVRNSGLQTLDDVTLRALPSWFTREAIAVAQGQSGNGPVEIIRRDALHPQVEEIVECFGLGYHQPVSAPEYIFNHVQRFTLEATARDAVAVRREFEYDPAARPMMKMLDLT